MGDLCSVADLIAHTNEKDEFEMEHEQGLKQLTGLKIVVIKNVPESVNQARIVQIPYISPADVVSWEVFNYGNI